MQAIDKSGILQALDKVLASEAFRQAGKLSRFLRFTVESTARGESDRIKEYVVGLEVFDRDQSYDPRLDPVVRVEARRLRAKLQEYYAGEGAADLLRIDFPKGGYVPVFIQQNAPVRPAAGRRPLMIAAAGAIVLATAAAILWWGGASSSRVAVLSMRAYAAPEAEPLHQAADAITEQLIAALSRESAVSVISWPTAYGYKAAGKRGRQIGAELGVDAIAVVWARPEGDAVKINIHLLDTVNDGKMWVGSYTQAGVRPVDVARELRRRLLQK